MKKIDTPIYLEIYFEDPEDLNQDLAELFGSLDFKNQIKTELLERLEEAIKEKRDKLNLFRLVFYGVDLIVKKNQYKKLLNKVLEIYQEEEDYLKCIEIKNLIEKI
jgi:uncharacterized hydantoinase/oxoprolinase family protein